MDPSGVIESLFGVPRPLVGVIHTRGLPGTPSSNQGIDQIVEAAVAEARVYASAGFHGVIIENTHDRLYLKGSVGPEIVAALALIGHSAASPQPKMPRCDPGPVTLVTLPRWQYLSEKQNPAR